MKKLYSANPVEASCRTYKVCAKALADGMEVEIPAGLKPRETFMALVKFCVELKSPGTEWPVAPTPATRRGRHLPPPRRMLPDAGPAHVVLIRRRS